jgi:hypothetical protein
VPNKYDNNVFVVDADKAKLCLRRMKSYETWIRQSQGTIESLQSVSALLEQACNRAQFLHALHTAREAAIQLEQSHEQGVRYATY